MSWNVREGELAPEHVRTLGRLIYGTIFTALTPRILPELYAVLDDNSATIRELAETIPAERAADSIAYYYGFSGTALKGWIDSASREVAEEYLREVQHKRELGYWAQEGIDEEVLEHEYQRQSDFWVRFCEEVAGVERVARVAKRGIEASIADHEHVISYGLGMDPTRRLTEIHWPKIFRLQETNGFD